MHCDIMPRALQGGTHWTHWAHVLEAVLAALEPLGEPS